MESGAPIRYQGERRVATVPGTLDLADNARMAINGFVGITDPAMDYLPFGTVHWTSRTPHMSHWATADVGCGAKICESFPLMRLMSGDQRDLEIEALTRAAFLARIQDGLFWDFVDPRRPWRHVYNDSNLLYGQGREEDFCIPAHAARMLRAVLVYRQVTGDPLYDRHASDLVRGLRRIAVDREDYSYYPEKGGWADETSYPRSGWINTDEANSETEGAESSITTYHAHQIYGASVWYGLTGDPVALDLARRVTNYCIKPRFWGGLPDPNRMLSDARGPSLWHAAALRDPAYTAGAELGHWHTHFHARATVLRGMLEYGRTAGDERVVEFVRRAYEYTLTQGIPRMGYVNCYPAGMNMMEGCALGDLVALGIRLTDARAGDYWDDVDAVVRNQLVEQQVTDAAELHRVSEAAGEDRCRGTLAPLQGCWDHVIDRTVGIYAGTALPHAIPTPWSMVCCTGNGTQGLYYAWEGTLREAGDRAVVNLLLNRAGRLVDVESHLPYTGKVLVRVRAARRLHLRVPTWVSHRDLRLNLRGRAVEPEWAGSYLVFDSLVPGDVLALEFPIRETTQTYTVNANTDKAVVYTCTFRGSTLVEISPRDESATTYRTYRRAAMRSGTAPLKTKELWVPRQEVSAW